VVLIDWGMRPLADYHVETFADALAGVSLPETPTE